MGLPKIKEIKTLKLSELEDEILNSKKHLFNLRLLRSTRQDFKSHRFKHIKHRLRQLMMIKKISLENKNKVKTKNGE